MTRFELNGETIDTDADPDMPLLWFVRDRKRYTGTKFGCGVGLCGACTVHIDGQAARSCITPISAVEGASISTIETLAESGQLSPVQQAWIDEQVPQCGYCQSGMIMAVTAMLQEIPNPTDDEIDLTITNICRCGTYDRIRKAIHRAARLMAEHTQTAEA